MVKSLIYVEQDYVATSMGIHPMILGFREARSLLQTHKNLQ